jgi:uncharacterized protein YggT (Ycf19 family)
MALLLRVWMQWARCDFYNPSRSLLCENHATRVRPLRRVIPAMGPVATPLVAFVLSVIKASVLFMVKRSSQLSGSGQNHRVVDFLGAAGDGNQAG